MTHTRWIAASVLALALAATPSHAGKPQPPPTSKIVASCLQPSKQLAYLALASDGVLYQVDSKVGTQCIADNIAVVALGSPFGGPPPAPVLAMYPLSDGVQIVLSNGDIWGWCSSATPSPLTFLNGNIFTVAGTAARMPDFSMQDFAPPAVGEPTSTEDDTPEAVRPGAEK